MFTFNQNLHKTPISKNKKIRDFFIDTGVVLLGVLAFAMCFNVFLIPANIYSGGCTGIAMILHRLFGVSTGIMVWALNIPLIATFTYFFGFRASAKGIIGISTTSFTMFLFETVKIDGYTIEQQLQYHFKVYKTLEDAAAPLGSVEVENVLLCAIFGGVLLGAALGIMFTRGFTTGGTDLITLLLRIKFKRLSTPKTMLVVDGSVVVVAAFVTGIKDKDFFAVFFVLILSLISIYMSTSIVDLILGGLDRSKLAYIFTSKPAEISDVITTKMHRGVTLLHGQGWYTHQERDMLLCVMKKNELHIFKKLILTIDPNAFVIISNATETIGSGFKAINVDDVPIPPRDLKKKNAVAAKENNGENIPK